MRISSFDEQELAVLIMALRYWRAQRRDGNARHSDPPVTPATIDLLLAKLRYGAASTLPPDEFPADLYLR